MASVEQNSDKVNTTYPSPSEAVPSEQEEYPDVYTKVMMSFEEPYYAYVQTLQDVWKDRGREVERINNDFAQGLQELWADVQRRSEEAYRKYMTALQSAMGTEHPQTGYEEAYRDYLRDLQNAWGPADYVRWSDAYQTYVGELQQVWDPDPMQRAYEEAFRNYVSSLQKIWGQIDPGAIDAMSLARISQSMATVAYSGANAQAASYWY